MLKGVPKLSLGTRIINNKVRNIIATIIFAIVLAWVYFSLPPLGLYATDQGAKYIQMKSFQLNHWERLDIEYPGKSIGLDLSYFNPPPLFIVNNNVLFCSYPPLFTFISSFFLPFLGDRVIHFLPLLSFFLSLIILARILKMIMKSGLFYDFLLLIFLIGSPVLPYTITFYEHLPAVFLVISSFYCLVCYFKKNKNNSSLFLSSLLIGVGIFFSTEMLLFCCAYVASLVWVLYRRGETDKILPVAVALFLSLSAYTIFNLISYGNLLGLHATYHQPKDYSIYHVGLSTVFLFVCSIVLLILSRYQDKYSFGRFINWVAILWLMINVLYIKQNQLSMLLYFFPLFLVIFFDIQNVVEGLFYSRPDLLEVIWGTLIIYTFLIAIFLSKLDISARFVLQVVPLVIIFMGLRSQELVKLKPLVVVILAITALSTYMNINKFKDGTLRAKLYNSKRLEFIENNTQKGDIIIFSSNSLMEHCGPLFFERVFIIISEKHSFTEILNTLKQKGMKGCYYWAMKSESISQLSTQGGYDFKKIPYSSEVYPLRYLIKINFAQAAEGQLRY